MGVLAWIVLGLIAGYFATRIVGTANTQKILVTCLVGVGGALLGGFLAVLLDVGDIAGFFSAAAWMAAIVGSAILLLLYTKLDSRPGVHR